MTLQQCVCSQVKGIVKVASTADNTGIGNGIDQGKDGQEPQKSQTRRYQGPFFGQVGNPLCEGMSMGESGTKDERRTRSIGGNASNTGIFLEDCQRRNYQ